MRTHAQRVGWATGLMVAIASEKLRFKVGDEVLAATGDGDFGAGIVVKLFYREPHFAAGVAAPYQVRKHDGQLIFTPKDTDRYVRAVAVGVAAQGSQSALDTLDTSRQCARGHTVV